MIEDGATITSTMQLIQIDPSDPSPLHEQVAASIRRAINEGTYSRGQRLPTAKDIAVALDVNPNTVLRALRRLREEGVLEFRRGRGIRVTSAADQRTEVIQQVRELVSLAARNGISRKQLCQMIEEYE